MTHDEQIKIDNFKAQYNSIKGNIAIANRELEEINERKESLKITCLELDRQVEAKSQALHKLIASEDQLTKERESKEANLKEREEGLVRDQEKLAQDTADTLAHLSSERAEHQHQILELKSEIASLALKRDEAEKDFNASAEQAAMLSIDLLAIEQELETVRRNLEEATQAHNSFVTNASAEKKNIQERINILLAREQEITKANQERAVVMERREEALARRERDVEIIANRWRTWHKSMFPDGELKI